MGIDEDLVASSGDCCWEPVEVGREEGVAGEEMGVAHTGLRVGVALADPGDDLIGRC